MYTQRVKCIYNRYCMIMCVCSGWYNCVQKHETFALNIVGDKLRFDFRKSKDPVIFHFECRQEPNHFNRLHFNCISGECILYLDVIRNHNVKITVMNILQMKFFLIQSIRNKASHKRLIQYAYMNHYTFTRYHDRFSHVIKQSNTFFSQTVSHPSIYNWFFDVWDSCSTLISCPD